MGYVDRFKKRMDVSGGSLRQEHINDARELLNYTFEDDPSFTDNICFWQLGKTDYEDEQTLNMRMYSRKFSSANGTTFKFQTFHDTIVNVGDILYNKKTKEYYICMENFDIDEINHEGKLTLCNWILKWQDKVTGNIFEYPCYIINATQYNSGETDNRQFQIGFTVGSSQHIIFLPYDENTVLIDNPMRFFLDRNTVKPTAFAVTQNDTISYNIGEKGIVRITVTEDVIRDKDNIELGICDYFEVDGSNTPDAPDGDTGSIHVKIEYDTDVIKSGGDAQTFAGITYDENGNSVNSVNLVWNIVCDDIFKNKLEVSKLDNTISIGIDDDDFVDEEFKLVLRDENNISEDTLIVRVESLL